MGVLADVAGPLGTFTSESSLPTLIAAGFASFLTLAVVLNVLAQLLLKNPNEPPVVFHLFPIIGSTITYGIDPYKFFFANQKKVCSKDVLGQLAQANKITVWQCLHLCPSRPQDDRVLGYQGQQFHPERKDQGCQR
jgi:hypothetical protein